MTSAKAVDVYVVPIEFVPCLSLIIFRSETSLRLVGNTTISNEMSIKLPAFLSFLIKSDFIIIPSTSSGKPGKKTSNPGKPTIELELFIMLEMVCNLATFFFIYNLNNPQYQARLERINGGSTPLSVLPKTRSSGKRRSRTDSTASVLPAGPSKLPRFSGRGESITLIYLQTRSSTRALGLGLSVGSEFCLPPGLTGRSVSATSTKMVFEKILCVRISTHGDPIFEQKGTVNGYLGDSPIAQGTMKSVFDVSPRSSFQFLRC